MKRTWQKRKKKGSRLARRQNKLKIYEEFKAAVAGSEDVSRNGNNSLPSSGHEQYTVAIHSVTSKAVSKKQSKVALEGAPYTSHRRPNLSSFVIEMLLEILAY